MSSVIKCSLKKALQLPGDQKHDFLARVEELVLCVSQLMRRGSLLSLLHYTRLLETEGIGPQDVRLWDDTGWRHAMTMGVPGYAMRALQDPELLVSYERFKHILPVLPGMTHHLQAET